MAKRIRRGVLMIAYRRHKEALAFLVLHRVRNWTGWELPKGGIEPRESAKGAVIRELGEECACRKSDILRIHPTGQSLKIRYPKAHQERTGYHGAVFRIFAVELAPKIRISLEGNDELEHDSFRWLPIEKASQLVRPNIRRALKRAAGSILPKQSGHSKNARLQRYPVRG